MYTAVVVLILLVIYNHFVIDYRRLGACSVIAADFHNTSFRNFVYMYGIFI